MATFRSLAKDLDKFNDRLPKKVNKLAQQTASDVLNIMTDITRVDTSKAVSNWRIGLAAKDPSTRSPFFAGKRGSTAAASKAEVRTVGRIKIKQKKPGQDIHITNSVDYIEEIDDGFEQAVEIPRQKLKERIQRFKV